MAANIAQELGAPLDNTHISRFSNDNMYIQLGATVRYHRVYIVQSLSQPVKDHLMELFMMLDIARSAAASKAHAIIPYYSFARSDLRLHLSCPREYRWDVQSHPANRERVLLPRCRKQRHREFV